MATKAGLVQVKDLIKQGKLSEHKSYVQGFLVKDKIAGKFEIYMHNNFVYFYAKRYGAALPFRDYRITRNTTLQELHEDIERFA